VGKTAVAVRIAAALGGEIISADSRQVYRGLDIGSGKALGEYHLAAGSSLGGEKTLAGDRDVPYHLIDIAGLSQEYNVFSFLKDAYRAFEDIRARGRLPVIVGGTGMYVDAFIRGYEFNNSSQVAITNIPFEHNPRHKTHQGPSENLSRPMMRPLILGTTLPRELLRQRIAARLKSRLEQGMLAEVEALHAGGASWGQLERLGLEYRFCAQFLQGTLQGDLFTGLHTAICRFAKRQETWFRGMARRGIDIHWLKEGTVEERVKEALAVCGN
jgi:tRNA dimethylallyltransferase